MTAARLFEEREPLAGQLLRLGDLAGVHFLGDLVAPALGLPDAAGGRQVEPFVGDNIIGGDPLAGRIGKAKIVEGISAPSFRVLLILSQAVHIDACHDGLPSHDPVARDVFLPHAVW